MADEEIDRKIAVIFATDVVGYSKHMESNEKETIKSLKVCEKILRSLFKRHKGRLFATGGDSFLAEFNSAVAAVNCAVEFQQEIQKKNKNDDEILNLQFRVGINSGDVAIDGNNLLGDGVNIAARLEALALPDGVTVSKVVHDFVQGKTDYKFEDLGVQQIKSNKFHAYDLVSETTARRISQKNSQVSPYLPQRAQLCWLRWPLDIFFLMHDQFRMIQKLARKIFYWLCRFNLAKISTMTNSGLYLKIRSSK